VGGSLAETLRVGASTILHHLCDSLGSKPFHFRRVLHELTHLVKEKRVVMCRELPELRQVEETFGFSLAVTGDELWLHLNCSHTHVWSVPDDERPVRADETIASKKPMLTVLWSITGRS
jgi:hypothetical protein